jgi:hypothetical protein
MATALARTAKKHECFYLTQMLSSIRPRGKHFAPEFENFAKWLVPGYSRRSDEGRAWTRPNHPA